MNMSNIKDQNGPSTSNSGPTTSNATTIPSLKRTLSGGATSGSSVHSSVGSHGMGMNTIPSVLHTSNPNTGPPQMLRAVTSSGVFNRPVSNAGANPRGAVSSFATSTMPTSVGARSVSQSSTNSGNTMQDWRMYLTIEERQAVRSKIRDAYASRCNSFEDLLQVACAIEEELLHISAPSRLDYFKSGFEFENRVKLKKDQLQGQLAALDAKRRLNASPKPHATSGSNSANGTGNSGNNPSLSPGSSDGSYNKKQRT